MGIKGLIKLIKKYSKNGVKQGKLSDYHNGVLFVDTSIYILFIHINIKIQ